MMLAQQAGPLEREEKKPPSTAGLQHPTYIPQASQPGTTLHPGQIPISIDTDSTLAGMARQRCPLAVCVVPLFSSVSIFLGA